MKKLFALLFVTTLGVNAFSQTSNRVSDRVSIELKKVHRIAKYGWDNMEVDYKLTLKSSLLIKRIDFEVALFDSNNNRIAIVEVHNFHIGRKSKAKYKYIDMNPDYINVEIHRYELIPESLRIRIDQNSDESLAKNQSSGNAKMVK